MPRPRVLPATGATTHSASTPLTMQLRHAPASEMNTHFFLCFLQLVQAPSLEGSCTNVDAAPSSVKKEGKKRGEEESETSE
jgi:hypothetical protein